MQTEPCVEERSHESLTPEAEQLLLLSAQRGDEEALDRLVRSYRRFVLKICAAQLPRGGAGCEPEDAAQVALVRFVCYVPEIDPDRPLAPVVGQIARHTC